MPVLLLVLAALAASPPTADGEPLPATEQGLAARARDLLDGGEAGRGRLAAEAARGPAGARRAALEALAELPAGKAPPGTMEAALEALGSPDPLLRRAAGRVLLGAGERALEALGRLEQGPVEGLPAVRPERARDARFDLLRAAVEREFLGLWTSDDGTFHGMYAGLRRHGAFGARVLAAIATDRRMAAGEVLGFGPYAWLEPQGGERDRSECRGRALEALADAGDEAAREMLRPFLRRRVGPDGVLVDNPAAELFDELDRDPVPAHLDDALREAIAALGDEGPLRAMIDASEGSGHSVRDDLIERRRRAGAWATLAAAAPTRDARLARLKKAEVLLRSSLRDKPLWGLSVDGVEHYNLACLLGRRDEPGDRGRALRELEIAVESYAVSAHWLQRDGDLASLREEPRFLRLVERLRAKEKALEDGNPVPR